MRFAVLVSAFLLPVVSLAHDPSPLLADDGRDLSFLLKLYDGPAPILRRAKRHIVPRAPPISPDDQVSHINQGSANNQGSADNQRSANDQGSTNNQISPNDGHNINQCDPKSALAGVGACCPSGNLVCAGNCCSDAKGDCCPNVGCCPAGQVCFTATNGTVGCCSRGQTCTTISGCADPATVACPGENFCCRPGTTCSRDAARNAVCLNPTGGTLSANAINAAPTPGIVNITNNNTNIIRTGATPPQVAAASGLMVTVAFLSAFLV